ncbi:hypothetical protein B0H13DRAFT_1865896 [Mycena leptocephala]|nr:hypothetical protein B0H13DRAFT_1865896 [Mycena leptocephala]
MIATVRVVVRKLPILKQLQRNANKTPYVSYRHARHACGPGQTVEDLSESDSDYTFAEGFVEFKHIILRGTIAFLTALSGKQISKKPIIDEEIVESVTVDGIEEAIVNANYRFRINAVNTLLQSWHAAPPFYEKLWQPELPFLEMQSFMVEILAELPIAVDVVNNETMPTAPHTLNELRLSGIHALIIFPKIDGSMPYAQTKEREDCWEW